jgi:hypothetical protein
LAKWNKREDAKETDSEQIGNHPAHGRILHIFSSVPRVVRSKLCVALPIHTQQIGTKSSCKIQKLKLRSTTQKEEEKKNSNWVTLPSEKLGFRSVTHTHRPMSSSGRR